MVGDEDVSRYVEDESVQVAGVEGQGVVIVEAVDLDVAQAHFIVGKNSVWVGRVGGYDWDEICQQRHVQDFFLFLVCTWRFHVPPVSVRVFSWYSETGDSKMLPGVSMKY